MAARMDRLFLPPPVCFGRDKANDGEARIMTHDPITLIAAVEE